MTKEKDILNSRVTHGVYLNIRNGLHLMRPNHPATSVEEADKTRPIAVLTIDDMYYNEANVGFLDRIYEEDGKKVLVLRETTIRHGKWSGRGVDVDDIVLWGYVDDEEDDCDFI